MKTDMIACSMHAEHSLYACCMHAVSTFMHVSPACMHAGLVCMHAPCICMHAACKRMHAAYMQIILHTCGMHACMHEIFLACM